eukprot:6512984-Prymnesium_polylepis.1
MFEYRKDLVVFERLDVCSRSMFTPHVTVSFGGEVPVLGCGVCCLTGVIFYWRPGDLATALATWRPAGDRRSPADE